MLHIYKMLGYRVHLHIPSRPCNVFVVNMAILKYGIGFF